VSWTTFRSATDGQCEGGRAVPQAVQPNRRQPGFVGQAAEGPREPVRTLPLATPAGQSDAVAMIRALIRIAATA
jgi:hypothetical protein